MDAVTTVRPMTNGVRLRPIVLPVEHGGWGLLLEPIVLGLILAPSVAGFSLSVAAIAAFLARHPFKVAIGDLRRGRRITRTAVAVRFAAIYFFCAVLALVVAIKSTSGSFVLPLLVAAPIVVIQLIHDSMGRSRSLLAELAGAISTGGIATTITLSGRWPLPLSFALWAILAARAVPTILYLRARLRLLHNKPATTVVSQIAHVAAIGVVIVLAYADVAPWLAVVTVVVLLIRSIIGLANSEARVTPKQLGFREVVYGTITVLLVALGYRLGW